MANFIVNSIADNINPIDGALTLREAIAFSNSAGGADIIDFNVAPNSQINLTSSLIINDSLTINGSSANNLSIAGNSEDV